VRIINTRPQPDAGSLTQALESLGHEVIIAPILEIEFSSGLGMLNLDGVQAVLATSANGVRALARLSSHKKTLLMTVGDATARMAEELGFSNVFSAAGDVTALASAVKSVCDPSGDELLHVAGTKVAGNLVGVLQDAGFSVRRINAYQARVVDILPLPVASALKSRKADAVVFFSPRTARTFVRLLSEAGLAKTCHMLNVYCLSPAVATEICELSWRALYTASQPNQESLLHCLLQNPLPSDPVSQACLS